MEIPIEKSAEAINNYLLNITDNLKIQTDFDISPISLLKNVHQNDFSQMNVIPVTQGGTKYKFQESKRFEWVRWSFHKDTKNM
jgi:hypothetical protein